jgi:hypothetical protein
MPNLSLFHLKRKITYQTHIKKLNQVVIYFAQFNVTHMRKPEMKAVSGRTTLKKTSWDLLAGLASLLLTTVLAYRDLI